MGPLCLKSVHTPCHLTPPAGLTAGPTQSEPVTPAGPAAGAQLCLWVAAFALAVLGIGFYEGTGPDKCESHRRLLRDTATLTLSLGLAYEVLPSQVTAKPHTQWTTVSPDPRGLMSPRSFCSSPSQKVQKAVRTESCCLLSGSRPRRFSQDLHALLFPVTKWIVHSLLYMNFFT